MRMKTAILFGSPHLDGDTAALTEALLSELEGEAEMIRAYERRDISPCTDCRFCWKQPGCAIADGMQDIYEKVERADNIVLASPVYFSELTGPLLSLASRFQTYYTARVMRGKLPFPARKRGVLLLAAGGDGSVKTAEHTATAIFNQLCADRAATVISAHTDRTPARLDPQALEDARGAARILNRLYRERQINL